MLSPGKWHERVPKGRIENLKFRKYVLGEAARSAAVRRDLNAVCGRDILFWINVFGWCFEPRQRKTLPFISWPCQDRGFVGGRNLSGKRQYGILECIEDGEDLVIEKSRDMGASYISLLAMAWMWRYHGDCSFLMLSRKEELVDGDSDSLFWKIEHALKLMPGWMMPAGWDWRVHRNELEFVNPENGSRIDGDSTTSAAGVGGRRTAVFLDEFSRMQQGYEILGGTADVTNCRIFNFTPWGTNNAAYKLAKREDVRKLVLHWTEHPEKGAGQYRYDPQRHQVEVIDQQFEFPPDYNFVMDGRLRSPAYDREDARRQNPREMAVMWDIDYQGSTYRYFDADTVQELIANYARHADWEGDIKFDEDTARPKGFEDVKGGPLRLWMGLDAWGRPAPGRYAIGCDLCNGTGATNSCASILNVDTGVKVGEYTTPFQRPDEFAMRVVALCWMFQTPDGQPAKLIWEMQGPGQIFGKKVISVGFRRIFYRKNEQSLSKFDTDVPGWYPSPENRRLVLEAYRTALGAREFLNYSVEALEETLYFVVDVTGEVSHSQMTDKDDPSGSGVNHGDRCIADALTWRLKEEMVGTGPKKKEEFHGPAPVNSMAWRRELAKLRRQHESTWS